MEDSLTLITRLLAALASSRSDFRSTEALARELKEKESVVDSTLKSMVAVRRPAMARAHEHNLHRLVNRGLTKGERRRLRLAALTRSRY